MTSICVRSTDQQAVADAVRRLPRRMNAFVSPPEAGWVTVFEESMDAPDEDRLSGYTVMLSDRLHTAVIGFLVHESDVLLYTLAENGVLLDQFSSWPDYFDENLPTAEYERLQGKPKVLAMLAHISPELVRDALEEEHDFAEDHLESLVRLLRLPLIAAQAGYNELADDSSEERPSNWAAYERIAFEALPVLNTED